MVITDDLDMRALIDNFSEEEIALRTFLAGCDLLLIYHKPERALVLAEEAIKHVESGKN